MKQILTAAAVAAACEAVRRRVESPDFTPCRWGGAEVRPTHNHGAAFSLPIPAGAVPALAALALAAASSLGRTAPVAAGLILGGGASNLRERLVRGRVCDYLRFPGAPGPVGRYVYNLADLAVFAGAAGLLLTGKKE